MWNCIAFARFARATVLATTAFACILSLPLHAQDRGDPAKPGTNAPAQQQGSVAPLPTPTLPNGANAINEVYGGWTVNCRLAGGRRACTLTQTQGNRQTKQRVFAIELRAAKEGKVEGTVLMPFGLKLDNGAVLQLDSKEVGQGLRFSTCVPAGCLIPVSFPAATTEAARKGKTLTVASLSLATGEVVAFNVSLNGFAAALTRVEQLGD